MTVETENFSASFSQGPSLIERDPVEVLVVEDDTDARLVIASTVERAGYQVAAVATGEEGLERLRDNPAIGVALVDLVMPGMDGFAFCQALQGSPRLGDLHIIIVSGRDNPDDKTQGLTMGAADYLTKPFHGPELRARVAVGERIIRERRRLKAQRSVLQRMVREDSLTGLCNRRYFKERLAEEWARACRYHRPLSLIMGDLDHFKQINDLYGHCQGDRVLAGVGRLLRCELRETDVAARYGGEEFVLLLPETGEEGALKIVERLRRKIKEMVFPHPSGSVSVLMSFGVVTLRLSSARFPETMLDEADQALYAAKRGGRDRVVSFAELERYRRRNQREWATQRIA